MARGLWVVPVTLFSDAYFNKFLKNQGSGGILIRRDTKEQMLMAAEDYSRRKVVAVLGEMKNDKWVDKAGSKKKK